MRKIILTASLSLLLSACAATGHAPASAAEAVGAAEAARTEAATDYEWRDTGKIIEAANKAMEGKEYGKAVSLGR